MKAEIAHGAHSLHAPSPDIQLIPFRDLAHHSSAAPRLRLSHNLPDPIGPNLSRAGFGSLRGKLSHSQDLVLSATSRSPKDPRMVRGGSVFIWLVFNQLRMRPFDGAL